MFIDELTIFAKAGTGGDGVVRWRREKSIPYGGPSGGNGGDGGDVYVRAVRDLSILSKYTGSLHFEAENGEAGAKRSKYGAHGEDIYIYIPVGATVTDIERNRVHVLQREGEIHKILLGGKGGLGNEYFKSSTNRSPEEATKGKKGESGTFHIELSLLVDIGLIGLPNAGKTTLLNALTHARARVGSYPFTTLEPHLGDLYGYVIADIPGLIEGASEGKGLGYKFLKHVQKTKMLLHCVSLEEEDPLSQYLKIRSELEKFDPDLLMKEEWIILTKSDINNGHDLKRLTEKFSKYTENVRVLSAELNKGIKDLSDTLVKKLKKVEN